MDDPVLQGTVEALGHTMGLRGSARKATLGVMPQKRTWLRKKLRLG